jgi:CheY-like chemotaxis protein
MMPRMNGWETLTALRELAPELPVIIASGYSEVHLKTELVSQPTHLFLQKPYALADLTHMLRSILS